jgi:hypothetical protein
MLGAFRGLVWAYFRAVARVSLRVACAVAVLARFFTLFSAFCRGGYMRIPPKKEKAACRAFFAPLAVCPLALIAARKKKSGKP